MQSDNWEIIKQTLDQALQLKGADRKSYLDSADLSPEVYAEVESLLGFEEEASHLMQLSAVEFSNPFSEGRNVQDVVAGQEIGSYRLVSELGHGGMGAVYLAERADGKFSQRVALKLLKREMNTSSLRRHFQQEREILARLEHPHIARLLDAGTTDDGIPFLVMEYVDGLQIDLYCNKHELDLRERLELFRQVCSTVDFAHRNLVVHRDLKPSNILVTNDGVAKLLDFGISKILTTGLKDANAATVTRLGAMTPGYASPEQLRSESVTTATDVYSLGVMLYELLSGHRPFQDKESNPNEIYQAVIETDPPMPSVMADTGQRSRAGDSDVPKPVKLDEPFRSENQTERSRSVQTSPRSLGVKSQYLRGDLDNIVLKAMKKEPDRRYSSPGLLAEDLKRHLDGLPVTARPDTFTYRAEKFVKRHRFAAFAGALILLAVIAGVVATLWQARIAQAASVRAEKRFNDVRKLASSYLFDVYPQIENLEGSLKARETIVTNALEYLDSLSAEAGDDLDLQRELATAYEKIGDVQGAINTPSLGDIAAGIESYQKARNLREAALATDPANLELKAELAQTYQIIAKTFWHNSNTAGAEEFYERSLTLRREIAAADPSPETQNLLAMLLLDYGAVPAFNFQAEKALTLFDEALATIQSLLDKDPANVEFKKTFARGLRSASQARTHVSDHSRALDDLALADKITKELIAEFPNDYRLARSGWINDYRICEVYIQKPDGPLAVKACLKAIPFNENTLKKEPNDAVAQSDLATSYFNAARAFRVANDPPNTITYAERAIAVVTKVAERSPKNMENRRNIAIYETEIARAYLEMDQPEKAIGHLHNIRKNISAAIETDPGSLTFRYDLALAHRLTAEAFFKKGDRSKAIADIEKAIAIVLELREANALKDSDSTLVEDLEKEKASFNL